MRDLPKYVLNTPPIAYEYWEGAYVQKKFSDINSRFGEENVDHIAFLYMNAESILHWLPSLIHYLEHDAPEESFHHSTLLMRLSNEQFSAQLLQIATLAEKRSVCEYLKRRLATSSPLDLEEDAPRIKAALALWE